MMTAESLLENFPQKALIDALNHPASSPFFLINENFKIVFANAALANFLGVEKQHLLGKNLLTQLHPEDQPEFVESVCLQFQHNSESSIEMIFSLYASNKKWKSFQSRSILIEGNKGHKFIWISLRHITPLIDEAQSIHESEERFRTLFQYSPDALFVENKNGVVLDVNPAACALHRMRREDLLGKNIRALVPEHNLNKVIIDFEKLFNGEFHIYEGESLRSDGEIIPVEIRAKKIVYENNDALLLQVRDISLRKENEKRQLRVQQQIFKQNQAFLALNKDTLLLERNLDQLVEGIAKTATRTLEADQSMIWLLREGGQFLDCYKLYDLASDSFLPGMTFSTEELGEYWTLINKKRIICVDDLEQAAKKYSFLSYPLDERGVKALIDVHIHYNGKVAGYICFMSTRRKRSWSLEEQTFAASMADRVALALEAHQRQATEEKLRQRNFELDNFVYKASHDLRAPLNSIEGLIQLAQKENPKAEIKKYLQLMFRSTVKLNDFIKDLTDFTRNSRTELSSEEIDFNRLMQEVRESLSFMEDAERLNLELNIHSKGSFYSDLSRLRIIFNNLVSNAIKYQDFDKERSFIKVIIESGKEGANFKIIDNGIGISPEHQENIFNMFHRATHQSYGSGLGLYLVKEAVEKMGGSVILNSELHKGTVFEFRLPSL